MCIICMQFDMYQDVSDLRTMIQKAKAEKFPIDGEHMKEVEGLLRAAEKLEEGSQDWGKWWGNDGGVLD